MSAQTPDVIDVGRLGPQIGDRIADFRLEDQSGRTWTRDSILGPNGALLVLSRSVDWCPYCKTQMLDLQSRMPELEAAGLGLAVITYDSTAVMADFAGRQGITFPLLSDPGSATIKAYGLLNTTVDATSSNFGIPFPGTFVLDTDGVVTERFFEEAYQERTTVSSMMLALGTSGPPVAASRITTDHLQATTYVSDGVVAPGSLFSVVFDITPRERIHVYAPGADGYKVINLNLDPDPLLVARPVEYPESEIYFFEPLNERVPVFESPFRLTQVMHVSAAREDRAALADRTSITITGTLEYQACDDRVCFNPQSVPVSYTVQLRPLDMERATVEPTAGSR
ncbi:MAG: redoxin domain-containing protein [Acidobacteria bacterium]|nr:redoxin domain-containing protein [Acidobacteriota bacterium]